MSYLSPKLNKNPFTEQEDKTLLELVQNMGPKWVSIAKYFNGRTDNQIKNRYKVLNRKIKNDKPIALQDIRYPANYTNIHPVSRPIVTIVSDKKSK